MKFAKSFERELEEGDFPKEWISASIQYKHLKVQISPRRGWQFSMSQG